MSSLIFYTEQDAAYIASDTLAVDESYTPFAFTTKAIIVPHLRLVIAGTGLMGFSSRWFVWVNDHIKAPGIEGLKNVAQVNLRRLFADYAEEVAFPHELTTTIYHFGISEITGHICSFAFRSERDFEPEQLSYGLFAKPECVVPQGYELPFGIVPMMESQRNIQAQKPMADRMHIGGEIQVVQITHGSFVSYRLHRFDDFAATQRAIFDSSPET